MASSLTDSITSQMVWRELKLQNKFAIPYEIFKVNVSSREDIYKSPWFTTSEMIQNTDLSFCFGYVSNSFWLKVATESQKDQETEDNRYVDRKPEITYAVSSSLVVKTHEDTFSANWAQSNKPIHINRKYFYYDMYKFNIHQCVGMLDITINVVVGMLVSSTSPLSNLIVTTPGSVRAGNVLQKMLSSRLYPDVKLILDDGKTLSSHRAVLAANSDVFKAMFEPVFVEGREHKVKLTDVRAKVMSFALNFLYGGDIPKNDPLLCVELLALADRYQLPELMKACEEVLCKDTSLEVLELLLLADTHHAEGLKKAMLQRLASYPKGSAPIDKVALREISKSHPDLLAELLNTIL